MNTATAKKIPPPDNFTANFESADFSGTITFRHISKTEILFSNPSSVKGLRLIMENGKTVIEYSGMVFEPNGGKLTKASFGNMLVNIISDLIVNNESIEAIKENGYIKRTGKEYTAYQKEDGTITEIITKKHKIKILSH